MTLIIVAMVSHLLRSKIKLFLIAALSIYLSPLDAQARAQEKFVVKPAFRSTSLPLPRYVSLKFNEANMRSGPGNRYPIVWVYTMKGLPVEIILEFDHWRKIRAPDGEEGWVHKSQLSGKRTAITKTLEPVNFYRSSSISSQKIARVANGVVGEVEECYKALCNVRFGDISGWIERKNIWGVYAHEIID